jgi:AcrR family transcriptional regulator
LLAYANNAFRDTGMKTFTLRQIEIINVSVKLISRKGVASLTTRSLSKALGVTEPILYRHFKSKTDILAGILGFLEKSNQQIVDKIINQDRPSLDKIEALYRQHFKTFTRAPALTTVIFYEELYKKDKRLSQRVKGIMKVTYDALVNILEKGVRKGEIRNDMPPDRMAVIIMGTMRFLVTRWRLDVYKTNLVTQGRIMCQSFFMLFAKGADNEFSHKK